MAKRSAVPDARGLPTRRSLLKAGIALPALLLVPKPDGAVANSYPTKPIRLIVPYPAGGPTDIVARLYADKLNTRLGARMVVENKPGASGQIALEYIARAMPDGYTIGLGTASTQSVAPHIQKHLPYDPLNDFAPISLVSNAPIILTVSKTLPVSNLAEFLAFARSQSKPMLFGAASTGALTHLAGELLKVATGIPLEHVPYKGEVDATRDMLAGQIHLSFTGTTNAIGLAKQGEIKILGVASAKRIPTLADVPSIGEVVPGYEVGSWFALLGPRGLPAQIARLLSTEIGAISRMPDISSTLLNLGVEPLSSTPEVMDAIVRRDSERFAKLIRQADIKVP